MAEMRPPLDLWPSLADLASDYRTGTGERRNVDIGGVSVELNTRSSLNVLPVDGSIRRFELVAGEAVFGFRDSVTSPWGNGHRRRPASPRRNI